MTPLSSEPRILAAAVSQAYALVNLLLIAASILGTGDSAVLPKVALI